MFSGPIYDYNQLAREAEIEFQLREEAYENRLASVEPFYDDYDAEIKDGDWYLDVSEGVYSSKTIEDIYEKHFKEGKTVHEYIQKIYGEQFSYPCTDDVLKYYEECYKEGDVWGLISDLSWNDLKEYEV